MTDRLRQPGGMSDKPDRRPTAERLAFATDIAALQADLLELSKRVIGVLAQLDTDRRVELGLVTTAEWAPPSDRVHAVEDTRRSTPKLSDSQTGRDR